MKLKRYISFIVPLMSLSWSSQSSAQWLGGWLGAEKPVAVKEEFAPQGAPHQTKGKKATAEKGIKPAALQKRRDQAQKQKSDGIGSVKYSPDVPLPIPRPWGSEDAPEPAMSTLVALPNKQMVTGMRFFLFIARHDFKSEDIDRMRIAVRTNADDLALEFSNRIKSSPLRIEWSKGLEALVRGNVDAVLVTALSTNSDVEEGIAAPYRIVTIPATNP